MSSVGSVPSVTVPKDVLADDTRRTVRPNIDPGRVGPLPTITLQSSSSDGPSSGTAPNDPYATLASLFASTFGVGSGGGKPDQLAAQVVPVTTQGGGSGLGGVLVLGMIAGAGWYWWKHRKGAAHAS